jgi:proteic killer suppression protein
MIKSFKSKALELYAKKGITKKLNQNHIKNIRLILNALDTSTCESDFNLPGKNLHAFKERKPKVWSLDVSGNWRITFEFDGKDVQNVDYLDTH